MDCLFSVRVILTSLFDIPVTLLEVICGNMRIAVNEFLRICRVVVICIVSFFVLLIFRGIPVYVWKGTIGYHGSESARMIGC